jgi:hypothetical protein
VHWCMIGWLWGGPWMVHGCMVHGVVHGMWLWDGACMMAGL